MKKCLSSILALALTFSLVGCSGGSGSTPSASGSASGDSSDPKVSMNVSVPDADNSYIYAAAQEFKSRVEEYSNGSIELTIYPNGSLYGGDGNAAISSVGNGSLDIVILASSLYASFDPSFYVVSVPYLFDDTKQLQDYLNSDIGKDLFNSVESMGITCLGSWTRSFRQVTNSKKPINSPADLEGMVLRTPSNSLYVEFFTACGANATPMSFSEVYNALQLNTLDPTNDVGLAQMVMGSQTKGVTPMALAAAFQIFYDGEYTTPHLYTRVLDRDGNIYLENNATSYQALTPDTAYVMNRLLKNVLFSSVGTASGRYPNSNGMEAFGKTGTASDEKDLWFVGGTPYYVTAVWWGYDAPYDMTKTLSKQQAKTRTCVMAWKALMEQAQADLPYKAFPTSAGVVERRYCTQSGLLAGAGCPSTAVGYYRADDLPDTCTYSHAAPQAAAPAENTDDAVPTQPVIPTDTSALDTE